MCVILVGLLCSFKCRWPFTLNDTILIRPSCCFHSWVLLNSQASWTVLLLLKCTCSPEFPRGLHLSCSPCLPGPPHPGSVSPVDCKHRPRTPERKDCPGQAFIFLANESSEVSHSEYCDGRGLLSSPWSGSDCGCTLRLVCKYSGVRSTGKEVRNRRDCRFSSVHLKNRYSTIYLPLI